MSQPAPKTPQPKIVQRLVMRTLILILVLAACIKLYQVWKDKSQDLGALKPAQTVGWIAAVQIQEDGQQAIAISPDGKIIPCPGWQTGKSDREVTWNPSGNRVFFISDRIDNNFQILRWNPTDGSSPDQRSFGTRSHTTPQFSRDASEGADDAALITQGGFVDQYAPRDMSTVQLLPPESREVSNDTTEEAGGGQGDQFSGVYAKLGTSFRLARWCKDKAWIAAIMRREEGEVLILQYMTPNEQGHYPPPERVVTGEHIDFDVNPTNGSIVFAVQNFTPDVNPDDPNAQPALKQAKVMRNFMGSIDPGDAPGKQGSMTQIAQSPDPALCFGSPIVSPDGASVAFVVGEFRDGSISPKALMSAPIATGGIRSAATLAKGPIFEPSWSADGDMLAFAQDLPSGARAIFEMHKDGSGLKNLTGDTGHFSGPVFSPQKG